MQSTEDFDLVTIGNYTKDTIVTRAGTHSVDGGGYSYAAHAAALRPIRIAAVTHLADEDRPSTEPLRAKGVEVRVVESPGSTLMRLEYPTDDVDQRVLTVAALADAFTPEVLAPYRARAWVVNGSVRGEIPLEVMKSLRRKGGLLTVDLQGFIRVVTEDGRLAYREWPEQDEILVLVDILKTDAVEAEFLTGEKDLRKAAAALAARGPGEIVLTHRDGVLVYAGGEFIEAAFHPKKMRGRSGRGDTCMGSYVSARLDAAPAEATAWAAAVTSLKLENEGPIQRARGDVDQLLARHYRQLS